MRLIPRNLFSFSTSRPANPSPVGCGDDLEMYAQGTMAPAGVVPAEPSRGQKWLAAAGQMGLATFVERGTHPSVAIPLGLHTLSMVGRQAMPTYVESLPLALAQGTTKLALSLVAPAFLAGCVGQVPWAFAQGLENLQFNPSQRVILTAVAWGLAFASVLPFATAETVALGVSGAGSVAKQAINPGAGWKKKTLAAACIVAILIGREGGFIASTQHTIPFVLPPYDLSPEACNGAPENCLAQYCDVVHPATHNSMALPTNFDMLSAPLSWVGRYASNQWQKVKQQLDGGFRGGLLEFYEDKAGELRTSHNTFFNIEPLETTFRRYDKWLAKHPRDFIVLQLSPQQSVDYTPESERKLISVLERSGLAERTIQNTCGVKSSSPVAKPACRLQMRALLDHGVQAVVAIGTTENTYSANTIKAMSCIDSSRLDANGSKIDIVTMNAFVTLADEPVSVRVNKHLPEFVQKCTSTGEDSSKVPTLLAVNHGSSSDVVAIADHLNRHVPKRLGDPVLCPAS